MVEEVSPEELKQWVYVDESETFLFNVGRLSLWGVLNHSEDARFGFIAYEQ